LAKHQVFVEAKAQRQLKKLPKVDQARIIEALNILETEGLSAGVDVKKLRGFRRHYRVRVGVYRIRFELLAADQTIIVYSISHREHAYQ